MRSRKKPRFDTNQDKQGTVLMEGGKNQKTVRFMLRTTGVKSLFISISRTLTVLKILLSARLYED